MNILRPSTLLWKCLLTFLCTISVESSAQLRIKWDSFPSLPDREGMAGMYGGVSGGALFCMGGANFPEKRPWEGGKKVWYDRIYRFDPGAAEWKLMTEVLFQPAGYGVSVSFKDEIILVGGSHEKGHLNDVHAYKWNGRTLNSRELPSLPFTLANMAGSLVDSLLILSGGTMTPDGPPIAQSLLLDLSNPAKGWVILPDFPGLPRTQAVAGSYKGRYYLFGGESLPLEVNGIKSRQMLRDVHRFIPVKTDSLWSGHWETLKDMPRPATAAAMSAPVSADGHFYIWGGVDDKAARHTIPSTHPGFTKDLLTYQVTRRRWKVLKDLSHPLSRVTLPAVYWRDKWYFINGEIRPGVRTPSVLTLGVE